MANTVAQSLPSINTQDLGALITLTADGAGTVVGNKQSNSNGRGVVVSINITALTGTTPTLTVNIYGDDNVSGGKKLLLASTALNAVSFTQLVVYPGTVAAANSVANLPLPASWHVETVVAGTTPAVTATIGASVIK